MKPTKDRIKVVTYDFEDMDSSPEKHPSEVSEHPSPQDQPRQRCREVSKVKDEMKSLSIEGHRQNPSGINREDAGPNGFEILSKIPSTSKSSTEDISADELADLTWLTQKETKPDIDWNKKTMIYKCNYCDTVALDHEGMGEHMWNVHNQKPKKDNYISTRIELKSKRFSEAKLK